MIEKARKIRIMGTDGITFVEILIAVAMFAVAFMPIASIISRTTRRTHEMNYEVVAEGIGTSILEQVVKTVPFEKVTKDITVGKDDSKDIKLEISENTAIHKADFTGDKTGSVIKLEGAEYKWDIEVVDIDAKDLPLSFWDPRNDKPKGSKPWPTSEIGTKNDGLDKVEKYLNEKAENFTKGGKNIIIKTVRLTISWQNMNETTNNFKDERRKFILVTRKARLEDDASFR